MPNWIDAPLLFAMLFHSIGAPPSVQHFLDPHMWLIIIAFNLKLNEAQWAEDWSVWSLIYIFHFFIHSMRSQIVFFYSFLKRPSCKYAMKLLLFFKSLFFICGANSLLRRQKWHVSYSYLDLLLTVIDLVANSQYK